MTPEEMEKNARRVLLTFGDRRNSGFCVKCGTDLLEPVNDYQCCSKCTKDIEDAKRGLNAKIATYHRQGKPLPKTSGRVCVQSSDILRQVRPIGVPVK